MTTRRTVALGMLFSISLLGVSARAENWSNWRGPNFDGSSPETNLPDTLSLEKNLVWKTPMLGRGGATPAIWGDKVFVSSADDNSKELYAVCYNRADGKELWRQKIGEGDYAPNNGRNNMASPSPTTDGTNVIFMYGTGNLACLDMSGKIVWQKNVVKEYGPFTILWGYGSSPLLFGGKLYITVLRRNKPVGKGGPPKAGDAAVNDHPLDCYILALNPKDGGVLWRHVRPSDAVGETLESFATPMPVTIDGKSQLIINDGEYMTGHDAEKGTELWRFGSYTPSKAPDRRMVPSPVAGAGFAYVNAAKHGSPIYAVKLNSTGAVKTSDAAWTIAENQPDCSTPLFYNGFLYVLDGDRKNLMKIEPKTGKVIWTGNIPGKAVFRASASAADGKIYVVRVTGEVYVLSAGDEFKILCELALGEGNETIGCVSSVAISQGNLFVRTPKTLYCFKK